MTTLTAMFEGLHVTELHILLTLSVVLKSVFSNSATCSSSSLNVERRAKNWRQNNEENYRGVNKKTKTLNCIKYHLQILIINETFVYKIK